jgi:hypothetical protein
MQAEIEAAFSKWMRAKYEYEVLNENRRPEREIQSAYDRMKHYRTQYRNLKRLNP